jgi:hypothetical protein
MNIRSASQPEIKITEHARLRASERNVSMKDLNRVLSDPDYITKNSREDPDTKRYVLRHKNLRVVWELTGGVITILSVFAK